MEVLTYLSGLLGIALIVFAIVLPDSKKRRRSSKGAGCYSRYKRYHKKVR